MFLSAVAFASAFIVLLTIIARGADHPNVPDGSGWLGVARMHAEKMALLMVGVAAGWKMLSIAVGIGPSAEGTMLLAGTALWMISHPAGWLAYVAKGKASGYCKRAAS